ncbi:MAG: BTAD domain-containing putative transcriptional regulator, partial [Chloroflexota bacterium]
ARQQLVLDPWHEEGYRQLMRALDGMGLRSDALAQYESCREILKSELGVEPEWATKTLYEQIKEGRARIIDAKGLSATSQLPILRLPKQLIPLVGREQEIDKLREDITNPACRMITIVGAGGVGKTSLALDVAWQAVRDFNDGACFVPLESLQASAGEDLQGKLAAAIGVALELTFSGIDAIYQQLYRYLSDKEMLLLLDNFEHLMTRPDGSTDSTIAAFLVTLMERAPAVKILITSRERFGIPAEYVLTLTGLAVPDVSTGLPALTDYSSVRLFVEQASRIQRDFELTPENGPAVAEICRLVDGLPLAIELAARWVAHFTCSEIASAIQENLNFLAAESPQVIERHQSIRATFSYSWRMLTADEQRMLARLSIILGQFSREAALAITQGSLGTLVRLQGKSLLRQEKPGYYSLHELLRQFVVEKLADEPAEEINRLRRRYCTYYLEELVEQGRGFNQDWTGEAIKEIAGNIGNIRSAWSWALDLGYFDLVSQALQPLYHYYRIQGLFHEAQQLFSQATGHFRALLDQKQDDRLLEELLGRSLLRQGRLAWILADMQRASLLLQESLDHLRKADTQIDLARGYAYLGERALNVGRFTEARVLLDKALILYRQERDNDGIAFTLALEGVNASLTGQFAEANRFFEEGITMSRLGGNRRLEGRGMHDWGMILLQQGKIEQAASLFKDSLAIAKELDLAMPIAFNQSMLARTDRHIGHNEHARLRLENSLSILEGSGYAVYTIKALSMRGEVLAILDQPDEARKSLENALAQLSRLQPTALVTFRHLTLDFLLAAAYLFAAMGRDEAAGHYLCLVRENAGRETDIGLRARQLAVSRSGQQLNQDRPPADVLQDEASLAQLLDQFSF